MTIGYVLVTMLYILFLGAACSEALAFVHAPDSALQTNTIMVCSVLLGMLTLYTLQRCAKIINLRNYTDKVKLRTIEYFYRRTVVKQLCNPKGVQLSSDYFIKNPHIPNPPKK